MGQEAYDELMARLRALFWERLAPIVADAGLVQAPLWPQVKDLLAEAGVLGLLIPAEYGGSGLTVRQYLPVISELAKLHGGLRLLVHVHCSFTYLLARIGSDKQRSALLIPAAAGHKSVAFALTESAGGSGRDVSTRITTANGATRLDGHKWLVSNATLASHVIVIAADETAGGGLSAVLVALDAPGVHVRPMPPAMGCDGSDLGEIEFDNVVITDTDFVGGRGDGARCMAAVLSIGRVFIAGSCLGIADRAYDLSADYAISRVTFDKPLADRPGIQRYLAEMAMDRYALSTMLADVAGKWDAGLPVEAESSLVKLFAIEAVARVTDRALLVVGGRACVRGHPLERLYRDARLATFEEGPPSVLYTVAIRSLLNERR